MTRVLKPVLAVLVLLAACGSGKSPTERVIGAPAATVAEGTARITQRLVLSPPAGTDATEVVITGKGAIDFARQRGTMTTTVDGQSVEGVFAGTAVYQRLPDLAAAGRGREWFKLDLDSVGADLGVEGLGNLIQSQSTDPTASLQHLRGATGPVEKIGKERIRGTDTTWYGSTVDLRKAADAAPDATASTIRQFIEVFGIRQVPVEVWVDSEGRARRVLQKLDYSKASGKGKFPPGTLPDAVEVSMEFYDFGIPVTVRIPPADQVADLAETLGRVESGAGSGTSSPATDALEARLVSEVPEGYERQPDSVGDTGPSDLEKAIRDDTEPDARDVLTDARFVAGYQRLWAKGEDANIITFLYQFEGPAGAAAYMERTLSGITDADEKATPFEVPGVPGGRGLRAADDEGAGAVIVFTRGPYLGQIVVAGPDALTSVPADLARRQYDRLG